MIQQLADHGVHAPALLAFHGSEHVERHGLVVVRALDLLEVQVGLAREGHGLVILLARALQHPVEQQQTCRLGVGQLVAFAPEGGIVGPQAGQIVGIQELLFPAQLGEGQPVGDLGAVFGQRGKPLEQPAADVAVVIDRA